jgi:hypothetical protein
MLTAIGFQKLWLNFIQSANVPRDCSQMQQLRPVAILNQRVCALEVLVRVSRESMRPCRSGGILDRLDRFN